MSLCVKTFKYSFSSSEILAIIISIGDQYCFIDLWNFSLSYNWNSYTLTNIFPFPILHPPQALGTTTYSLLLRVQLFRFLIKVRSCGTWLSVPGLFHLVNVLQVCLHCSKSHSVLMLPMPRLSSLSMGVPEFRDQVCWLTVVSCLREGKTALEHVVNLVPPVPILSTHTGLQLWKEGFRVETGLAVWGLRNDSCKSVFQESTKSGKLGLNTLDPCVLTRRAGS